MKSFKNLTISNFIHTIFEHIKDESHVLKEIGISDKRLTSTQIIYLTQLQLQYIFSSLTIFDQWMHDGLYDFHALPFSVKKQMSSSDKQFVEQCFDQWNINAEDYLPHVKELIKTLKNFESKIVQEVDDSSSHVSS